jgi:hypothetical protein
VLVSVLESGVPRAELGVRRLHCSIARDLVKSVNDPFDRLRRDFLRSCPVSTFQQLLLAESLESSSAWDLEKLVYEPTSDDSCAN